MQKRKQNIALAVSCAVLLVFVSVSAYTVSTESTTNSLTVGNIDITLTEEEWEENQVIVPDEELEKNPVVTNQGKNEAYIFAKVAVPYVENITMDYNDNTYDHVQGQKMPKVLDQPLPLFKFGVTENNVTTYDTTITSEQLVHENWVLVDGYPKKNESTGKLIYIYAYTEQAEDENSPTGLAAHLKKVPPIGENRTEPIFDKIRIVNYSDTYGGITGQYSVDVDAYGIQTEFLQNQTAANIKEVWNLLASELDGGDGT